MHFFNLRPAANQSLTIQAICNEIETQYQENIDKSCRNVVDYLRKNEQIQDVLPSVSELVHIIFYKVRLEIRQCFLKEKQELYPLLIKATPKDRLHLDEVFEPFKEKHQLILNIVQKLRQILCNYVTQPHWTTEFRNFVTELFSLENNIYKWIHVEEDLLFPKVISTLEKEKYIATVFR